MDARTRLYIGLLFSALMLLPVFGANSAAAQHAAGIYLGNVPDFGESLIGVKLRLDVGRITSGLPFAVEPSFETYLNLNDGSVTQIDVNLLYVFLPPNPRIRPYIGAGFARFQNDMPPGRGRSIPRDTSSGWNLVAGGQISIQDFAPFAEVRFTRLTGSDHTAALAGVLYNF